MPWESVATVSNSELTAILCILLLLVGFAHLLGYLFVKLRQPKVVGEILAGIVFGPALLGRLRLKICSTRANIRRRFWILFTGWGYCCSCSCPAPRRASFSPARSVVKSAGWPSSGQVCRSFWRFSWAMADSSRSLRSEWQSAVTHHCARRRRRRDLGPSSLQDLR